MSSATTSHPKVNRKRARSWPMIVFAVGASMFSPTYLSSGLIGIT